MKKKLVSVLLALTLCGSLAIPAFAEPMEESEVITGKETLTETECEHWHLLAECECEEPFEGTEETERHTVTVEFWKPCDGSCQDPMLARASSAAREQPSWYCMNCGDSNWDGGEVESAHFDNITGNTHTLNATILYRCQTCGTKARLPQSWTESHSLYKCDFGSNYHRGTLHYVEWYCRCECGYTTTIWESQSCPGNDNGEGCIFGINKVEPPVEVQDVTGPEETT